jgi:hypothetical protein
MRGCNTQYRSLSLIVEHNLFSRAHMMHNASRKRNYCTTTRRLTTLRRGKENASLSVIGIFTRGNDIASHDVDKELDILQTSSLPCCHVRCSAFLPLPPPPCISFRSWTVHPVAPRELLGGYSGLYSQPHDVLVLP